MGVGQQLGHVCAGVAVLTKADLGSTSVGGLVLVLRCVECLVACIGYWCAHPIGRQLVWELRAADLLSSFADSLPDSAPTAKGRGWWAADGQSMVHGGVQLEGGMCYSITARQLRADQNSDPAAVRLEWELAVGNTSLLLLRAIVSAYRNLARRSAIRMELVKGAMVQVLVRACQWRSLAAAPSAAQPPTSTTGDSSTPSFDGPLLEDAAAALATLALSDSTRPALAAAVIPTLVQLLKQCNTRAVDRDLQSSRLKLLGYTAGALANLALEKTCRAKVVKAGAVALLVRGLLTFDSEAPQEAPLRYQQIDLLQLRTIHSNTAGALCNLARNKGSRARMASEGAGAALVRLLGGRWRLEPEVAVQATNALANLAGTEALRPLLLQGGAVPTLVALVLTPALHLKASVHATSALASLSYGLGRSLEAALEAGEGGDGAADEEGGDGAVDEEERKEHLVMAGLVRALVGVGGHSLSALTDRALPSGLAGGLGTPTRGTVGTPVGRVALLANEGSPAMSAVSPGSTSGSIGRSPTTEGGAAGTENKVQTQKVLANVALALANVALDRGTHGCLVREGGAQFLVELCGEAGGGAGSSIGTSTSSSSVLTDEATLGAVTEALSHLVIHDTTRHHTLHLVQSGAAAALTSLCARMPPGIALVNAQKVLEVVNAFIAEVGVSKYSTPSKAANSR
jgi:hypothetical protein